MDMHINIDDQSLPSDTTIIANLVLNPPRLPSDPTIANTELALRLGQRLLD